MLTAVVNAGLVLLMAVLVVRVLIYNVALGLLLGAVSAFFARGLVRDAVRAVRWARVVERWERMGRPVGPRRMGFAEPEDGSDELEAEPDGALDADAAATEMHEPIVGAQEREPTGSAQAGEAVAEYRAPGASRWTATQLDLPLGTAQDRRDDAGREPQSAEMTRKPGSGARGS